MNYSFHHKSYCTVFSDCCQPLNDFLQGIYTLRLKMVAGGGIEPTILELMRLQCYQYTFPRQSVTVIYVGGRGS